MFGSLLAYKRLVNFIKMPKTRHFNVDKPRVEVLKLNKKYKSLKALAYVTQLGFNIITPVILCIIIAIYIKNKFMLGDYAVILGIIVGCGAGFMSLLNFIKLVEKENKSDK